MKRSGLIILAMAMVLVLAIIPKVLLVPRLAHEMEMHIGEALEAREVEVRIDTTLGWEVLLGRVDGIEVTVRDSLIDDLKVSELVFHGENVRFDPRSLWGEREVALPEAEKVRGELVVREEALNELLWDKVDPERFLKLKVTSQGIDLGGTMSFWNMEWTITLRGDLEVHHGTALRYVLKNFEVQETRIPAILLEVLSENYEFIIDFDTLPYPVELKDVLPQEGQILVTFGGLS